MQAPFIAIPKIFINRVEMRGGSLLDSPRRCRTPMQFPVFLLTHSGYQIGDARSQFLFAFFDESVEHFRFVAIAIRQAFAPCQ
ncbi:hypothetical protein [Caballeronia sp. Sq4a]|uniref:hypothetical protein n=1 Tax=Caballeronia sp. Sq4a TaxID=2878152 RepID=UPI0020BF17FC|nr:hypothetical protein [Caballeronia sp. Sq4a]